MLYHGPMTNEPHDFRFDIVLNPEPDSASDLYFITQIALVIAPPDETWPCETVVDGPVIDSWTCEDPYAAVEAAREAQAYTLEERMDIYAERGW